MKSIQKEPWPEKVKETKSYRPRHSMQLLLQSLQQFCVENVTTTVL